MCITNWCIEKHSFAWICDIYSKKPKFLINGLCMAHLAKLKLTSMTYKIAEVFLQELD